jgi:hypothetical protein
MASENSRGMVDYETCLEKDLQGECETDLHRWRLNAENGRQ